MVSWVEISHSFGNHTQSLQMNLDDVFLNNSIRVWVVAGAVTVTVWVLLYTLKHLGTLRLGALAQRTASDLDNLAAELVRKARWYFITAIALRAGIGILALTPVALRIVGQFVAVAVLLQLAVWGNALIAYWIRTWNRRRGGADAASSATLGAISAMARGLLWVVIAILTLRNVFHYEITALLTGLGIGGIAIALAVQNILGDLFAALSIVLDKPFEVGDAIAVDSFSGTVEHVGLKTTRVRAVSGEQVIFSNTDLLKSRVRNLKRQRERRAELTLGIAPETPPETVAAIPGMLKAAVEAQPHAQFDRAHFTGFSEWALRFDLVYKLDSADYTLFMDTQQAVNLRILEALGSQGIALSFPRAR